MQPRVTLTIFIGIIFISSCSSTNIVLNSFLVDSGSDPTFADRGTIRIAKKSRNVLVISGTGQFFQNVGNEVTYNWALYFKNPFTNDFEKLLWSSKPFCDFLDEDDLIVPELRKASNLPEKGVCPMPKGPLTVDNYNARIPENLPLVRGEYYMKAFMKRDNRMLVSFKFDFTVE